jgi:hypothetical protein
MCLGFLGAYLSLKVIHPPIDIETVERCVGWESSDPDMKDGLCENQQDWILHNHDKHTWGVVSTGRNHSAGERGNHWKRY